MPDPRAIRAGKAYVELGVQDRLAAGLKKASRKLRAFGTQVQAIGRAWMKMGAVMAAPLAVGVKVFADFERQMANVATMLDDSDRWMGTFREGIRKLAVETGESTDALAGGLYDILSASVAPAKALDVLAAATKAAKAGMTDTKTAADAITTILNSYGLAAERAADVSDWLFAVVKRGKTTFGQLAPSIGMVASTAATAGVPLEELGAMVATLTRNGVQTDNAITAINRTIATFLKPTDDAAEYARQLGFELSSVTLKAEGLEGVFRRIAGLPPDAVARLFPNIRALRGVLPALKRLDEFAGDVELMRDRAGKAEDAYAKMADTLAHQFNRLKQAAVIAAGRVGEALRDSVAAGAERIRRMGEAVAEWVKRNRQLIVTLAKAAVYLVAFGAAAFVIGKVVALFGSLLGAVRAVTVAIKALGVAFAFLGKHPVVFMLTMLGAALASLVSELGLFGRAADRAAESMARLRAEGDELRRKDRMRMELLAQLAEKEKLNNKEMKEARRIIDTLEGRYGDLGIALDETKGKIEGATEAQKKLNQAMRAAAIAQLEAEQAEIVEEMRPYLREGWTKGNDRAGYNALRKKLDAVNARLDALQAGSDEALFGQPGEGDEADLAGRLAAEKTEAARREADARALAAETADLDARIHRLRLQAIEDEHARQIALINARYAEETRKAKKTEAVLTRLDAARRLEIENAQREHQQRLAAEAARAAEERLARERDLRYQIARLQAEAAATGPERERALLELERRRAMAEAREAGIDVGLVERMFALRRQLLDAGRTAELRAAGTFRTGGLRGLFGGAGNAAERTARAAEATAKGVATLNRKADQGKLTFS